MSRLYTTRRLRSFTVVATLLALAGCEAAGRGAAAAAVDAPAPAYAATTLAGDSVALADLRGRVVLLNVWATWCHPCRDEIPVLQALHERHEAAGLTIVGVSIDAPGEDAGVRAFADEFGMTFPIWRDPDSRVTTLFAAIGVPATFLIDREGVVRWKKVGPIAENDPALAALLSTTLAE